MKLAMDLVFKEIDTIDVFDITSGDFMFAIDELTDSSIQHTEEAQDITGKNGRRISRTKRNKGVTVSGTNGIVSSGLMAIQTGGEFNEGATEVEWVDYLTVKSNTATTNYKAIGTLGAEIIALYVKNSNNAVATKLEQVASGTTLTAGKFTYDPATKQLVFFTETTGEGSEAVTTQDVPDGTEIIVYYKRKINALVLKNDSEKYSGQAMLYVNGLAEDKCANVYRVQFFFPKVDFSGEFSIDVGDSQTAHSFEAIALAGACGAGSDYYTYTIFGVDTADYTDA